MKNYLRFGIGILVWAVICLATILAFSNPVLAQLADQNSSIQLEVVYTSDVMSNWYGGQETGIRYMDNLDVTLNLDLDRLAGLSNSNIYIYGLANQGKSISELSGDIQGVSNIDTRNAWRLYEAWWQKQFTSLQTSVLLGLFDTNAEFDFIHTGQLFINSSHGIGPDFGLSGRLGPSTFPYTSAGIRLKHSNYEGLVIKGALLDGVPSDPGDTRGTKVKFGENDGLLVLGELNYSPFDPEGEVDLPVQHLGHRAIQMNNYRIALGGWLYTANRAHWVGGDSGNSWGLYLIGENRLTREALDPSQGFSAYLRLGVTNGDINRFGGYFGTGIVYTGLFAGRNKDQWGLAFAHAPNSPAYLEAQRLAGTPRERAESVLEMTYQWFVSKHLQVQGDMQYIINPNTVPTLNNALVTGLRFYIGF